MAVPLLDSRNKSNRNKLCGAWTLKGPILIDGAPATGYSRFKCKCWNCEFCGPKKAACLRKAIAAMATSKQLQRFLTLTLNPRNCTPENSLIHIRACWNKMRTYLKRNCGKSISFIAVIEFQKSGYAHLHILVSNYLDQKWLSKAWDNLGGGKIVDIRFVDIHRISGYLTKYLTKELILGVPQGNRRYSTSRDIKLFDKKINSGWELIKINLDTFARMHSQCLLSTRINQSGEILFFGVNAGLSRA